MQVQTSTTTMALPVHPASPTLTNPDMILPYDGEYDPLPSPPQNSYSPDEWRDSGEMQFSLRPSQMGTVTPTTPIIYGNGTMLSDIGEVTEAESTPGRKLPGPAERRMLKQAAAQNLPMRSSPTVGYEAVMKRAKTGNHQRNVSIESDSTVRSEGHQAEIFRDFDDELSVDDSVFQGDDEESVAESYRDPYREEVIGQETRRLAHRISTIGEDDDDDQNSSAALSRRAEQILLNAKQRLNNMEGNLNRARTSFFVAPSKSMSSIHSSSPLSRSTPSPPGRGLLQLSNGVSTHRQLNASLDSPVGTPGHSRVYSENSINSPVGKGRFPVRSASAAARYIPNTSVDTQTRLGYAYSSESLREDAKGSIRPSLPSPLGKISPPISVRLEPLTEDEAIPEFDRRSTASSIDGFITPNGESNHTLTRSASTAHMRDLRDQMSDLKGRLSVLRDRARDDSMKRRSLQSLRTPSPFTAAEQWYSGDKGYKAEALTADAGTSPTSPTWNHEPDSQLNSLLSPNTVSSKQESKDEPEYVESDVTSVYEDVLDGHHFSSVPQRAYHPPVEDATSPVSSPKAENEDMIEEESYNDEVISVDEVDDYESDSTYHDTTDIPISHEDREDAFDYEHFFLHSAMGTIGRAARGRTESFSSEGSVETTRGPIVESATPTKNSKSSNRPSLSHIRNGSNASVSTVNSFATAEESHNSGDEMDVEAETPRQDEFAVQKAEVRRNEIRERSPLHKKRSTFGGDGVDLEFPDEGLTTDETEEEETEENVQPVIATAEEDDRTPTSAHRPSVSSFDSCSSSGSRRSFPLVNKPAIQIPLPTAAVNGSRGSGGSTGSVLTSDTTTLVDRQGEDRLQTSPVHMLAKDDQILVERLVASLGKCVLGLQEAESGTYEARVWRRRLDAARRVLDGQEGAV